MSEAAELRCATPSAIRLPDTSHWSEVRPRLINVAGRIVSGTRTEFAALRSTS
jgi:hypothetical protein